MSLSLEALQELPETEEVGLAACPILGSCCMIMPNLPGFTFVSCFGCTFTS